MKPKQRLIDPRPKTMYAQQVAKRIREARDSNTTETGRRFSNEKLAQRTKGKLSASRIANWTQGIRTPKPEDMMDLAEATQFSDHPGFTAAYIYGFIDQMNIYTKEERELIFSWRKLPENLRVVSANHIHEAAKEYRAKGNGKPRKKPKS